MHVDLGDFTCVCPCRTLCYCLTFTMFESRVFTGATSLNFLFGFKGKLSEGNKRERNRKDINEGEIGLKRYVWMDRYENEKRFHMFEWIEERVEINKLSEK